MKEQGGLRQCAAREGNHMVDRDSGHTSSGGCSVACAVNLPLVRAPYPCFVRAGGGGGRPHRPPHRQSPPLRADAGGGGRLTNVWWWDHNQYQGSMCAPWGGLSAGPAGTRGGGQGCRGGSLGATEAWEKGEGKRQKDGSALARTWMGKREEAKKTGRGPLRGDRKAASHNGSAEDDARAMQGRHTGDARRTLWA